MRNLFFLFSIAFSVPLISQNAAQLNEIPVNYTLFDIGDITYINTLFDSTNIAASTYSKVSVVIVDSLSKRSGKGKYSEQLSFSFDNTGKISSGKYMLSHLQAKTQGELTYQYLGKNEVFVSNNMNMEFNSCLLSKYTSAGKVLYEKQWLIDSVKQLSDTVAAPYTTTNNYYKNGVLSGNTACVALFKKVPDCVSLELISAESSNIKTSCLYRSIFGADTLEFTTATIMDSTFKHPLFSYEILKGDTVSFKSWKYDAQGNLVYYYWESTEIKEEPKHYRQIFITRDAKGLPLKIVHRTDADSVTFEMTWQ